ncbi:MAG: EF-hand domain-containing protein [Betaproteobacteria bacterium]
MKSKLLALAGLTTIALMGSAANAQMHSSTTDAEFDRIYALMDTNKDGRISRAEYAAYHGMQFDTWDTTRSGMMSRDQMRTKQFERELRKTDGNPQGNSPTSVQKK